MSFFRESKLERPKRKKKKTIIIFFILLALLLSLIYISYWSPNKKGVINQKNFEEVKVDFWLEGSSKAKIGEEVQLTIKIANREDYALENIEIKIETPPDFLLTDSSLNFNQKIEKGYIWFLKEIEKGEMKEIVFKAQNFSQPQDKQFINGSLSFNLVGFNPLFEKKFSFSYTLEPSIQLTVSFPSKINLGQEIDVGLSAKNLATKEFSNLKVILPDNLIFKENESLKKEGEKTIWQIDKLLPQEEKKETVKAVSKGEIGQTNLEFVATGNNGGQSFSLSKIDEQILVEKPDVSLNIKINNKEGEEMIYSWGEMVPVSILYQNNSEVDLKNFRIKLALSDLSPLNLEKIKLSLEPSDKEVIFDKETNSDFLNIKAKTSGQVDFNLFLKDKLSAAAERIKEGKIVLKASSDYLPDNLLEKKERINLGEKETTIKIRTNLKLTAESRYYSDDYLPVPIGEGPLPFRVGEETKVWLFFRLKNTSNPIKDLVVKTILSPKITWLNIKEASTGSIFYNEETREISWQVDRLDSYQGESYSLLEAKVEITVKPEATDVNKVIPFTSKIDYTAQDEFTLEKIQGEIDQIDSHLADALINWQGEIR